MEIYSRYMNKTLNIREYNLHFDSKALVTEEDIVHP